MKVTLSNGVVVEGTLEQIQQVASTFKSTIPSLDDGTWYMSSTKGLVRIRDMETQHLRNALLKRYREFVSQLSTLSNNVIASEIVAPSDKTLVGLMVEFESRKRRGIL